MKTLRLILNSLVSNDAAIDGARKKPWYFAVIIFLFSIAVSLIPMTVQEGKNHLDKQFDSTTYLTQEAVTIFAEELQKPEFDGKMYVLKDTENKTSTLIADTFIKEIDANADGENDFIFSYLLESELTSNLESDTFKNISYFVFTADTVYINIKNPNDKTGDSVVACTCINAYKKIGENDIKNSFEKVIDESTGNQNMTSTVESTWSNWKSLLRKFYNQTRLKTVGRWALVFSIINVSITVVMGFLVWILTRGKNNPYRLFTIWESFKISFWAGLCPGLLTCGLGFLISSIARTMFPLLLGVRVMWLSMKSLRPDGSGYAAN